MLFSNVIHVTICPLILKYLKPQIRLNYICDKKILELQLPQANIFLIPFCAILVSSFLKPCLVFLNHFKLRAFCRKYKNVFA